MIIESSNQFSVFCAKLISCSIQLCIGFISYFKHVELIHFPGIPTDEEQATGLEKAIMKAMKEGAVRWFISCSLSLMSRKGYTLLHEITVGQISQRQDLVKSGFYSEPHTFSVCILYG